LSDLRDAIYRLHEINGPTLVQAHRGGHQPLLGIRDASELFNSQGAYFEIQMHQAVVVWTSEFATNWSDV